MSWKRARRPEQKQERRAAILEAAGRLFDEGGVDGASLTAIARAAGSSKANVYRYFESREAIFLELMVEEQRAWERAAMTELAALADSSSRGEGRGDAIEAVADIMTRSLAERPRLCGLMASLASVLEHNVGAAVLRRFKARFAEAAATSLIPALQSALPQLSTDGAYRFFMYHYMIAAGTWPHANPSEVVREVLADESFARMRVDFATVLRGHAIATLRGIICSSEQV